MFINTRATIYRLILVTNLRCYVLPVLLPETVHLHGNGPAFPEICLSPNSNTHQLN